MKTPDPLLIVLLFVLSFWQLFWKGLSIWRASRFEQRNWFIVLFILIPFNDFGIVELIYLFKFARKPLTISEIKKWLQKRK